MIFQHCAQLKSCLLSCYVDSYMLSAYSTDLCLSQSLRDPRSLTYHQSAKLALFSSPYPTFLWRFMLESFIRNGLALAAKKEVHKPDLVLHT